MASRIYYLYFNVPIISVPSAVFALSLCPCLVLNAAVPSFPQSKSNLSSPHGCLPKKEVILYTLVLIVVRQSEALLCVAISVKLYCALGAVGVVVTAGVVDGVGVVAVWVGVVGVVVGLPVEELHALRKIRLAIAPKRARFFMVYVHKG